MSQLAINNGTPVRTQPFPSWPVWDEREIENVTAVIKSGKWGRLQGDKVTEFEKKYAEYHNAEYALCTTSGTMAIRLALQAAGIGEGDEVILPPYTFIASAVSVIELGAVPVFVDIEPETYNINPEKIEEAVTPRTTAVMPVHFAGRPVDMDKINEIARKHNLKVIADAAQAWGSEWKGRKVGALGDAGAFSFQSSKNINAGEGGIILTNKDDVFRMLKSFSNCGRKEGGIWYMHYYPGGNFRMTELQGALLLSQFGRYEEQKKTREANAAILDKGLSQIPGITPVFRTGDITSHSYHLYILRYRKEFFAGKPKADFVKALQTEGIPCSNGYSIPLYKQPLFENNMFSLSGKEKDLGKDYGTYNLPESEKACYDEAVWFTQNILLGTKEDMGQIIEAVTKIQKYAEEIPGES